MNADRNLLLGLLALQLNFIDRQQLIAAFDRWTTDKAQSLGQILLDQGALAGDEHALLEALAAKHVERHDNDSQKSLADLTPVGSARDELQRLADPDVQASLAHVSAARGDDEQELPSTLSFTAGTPTSAGTRFRILRPHAHGGLGEVYVAVDEELHREVALKEIQKRHAHEPDSRARFLLEAEITGGLEHPGIVPVYGLGTYADGRPFYAMRFIRGDSLKEAIERFHRSRRVSVGNGLRAVPRIHHAGDPAPDGTPRSAFPTDGKRAAKDAFSSVEFRKLLGRFIDVCNAIEYAHSRGVLHRDLKPGNIMLGKYGETLVVDWGLAKVVGRRDPQPSSEEQTLRPTAGSGSSPTEMGRAVGTPQFMSPEQAEGRLDQLGPASDVYSLGATLYTLLTGQPPFAKDDTRDVVERVARGDFPRPREVNPDVPRGLAVICLKAMALAPSGRYPSPRTLADDIEHWLADEPVVALQDTIIERAARWTRRHRALARSAAAALLVTTAVSIAATIFVDQARREQETARQTADLAAKRAEREQQKALLAERDAEQAAEREKGQRMEAEHQARISNTLRLAGASQLARPQFPVRSVLLALEAVDLADERDTASLTAARQALRDGIADIGGQSLPGFLPSIGFSPFAFSPNGRWMAAASMAWDGTARLWDLNRKDAATNPIMIPGGGPSSADGASSRSTSGGVAAVVFSPDAKKLACAAFDGSIRLWNLGASEPVTESVLVKSHDKGIAWLEFSSDGRWLMSIGRDDKAARLWDLSTSDGANNSIMVSSAVAGSPDFTENLPLGHFTVFSTDSHWLAATSDNGATSLWDLRVNDRKPSASVLPGEKGICVAPKFSLDGHWLVAVGGAEVARLYDLTSNDPLANAVALEGHKGHIGTIEFSRDGRWLAIGSDAGIRLWELIANTQVSGAIVLSEQPVVKNPRDHFFAGFTANSHWLISWQRYDPVHLWNLTAKEPSAQPITLAGSDGFRYRRNVQLSPDGHWLAEADRDTARLWDLTAVDPSANTFSLHGHTGTITDLVFSADTEFLATYSSDGTARIWDLKDEEPNASPVILRGHDAELRRAWFSPGARWMATADRERRSRLWDLAHINSLAGRVVLRRQDSPAFSPGAHWLVTRSEQGKVVLWDLQADVPYGRSLASNGFAQSRAFSPDNRWLTTASDDGTLRLWDLTKDDPASDCAKLEGTLGPALTEHEGEHYLLPSSLAFSADGRWLAGHRFRGAARLWDLRKGPAAATAALEGCPEQNWGLGLSSDGHWLAVTGTDGKVRLWKLNTTSAMPVELSMEGVAHFLSPVFSADGRWLVARGDALVLWDLRTKNQALTAFVLGMGVSDSPTFSGDSRWLAASRDDDDLVLWDLTKDDPRKHSITVEESRVDKFAFSADSRWFVWNNLETLRLLDLATAGRAPAFFTLRGRNSRGMAFSLDGRWLASAGDDGTVRLWDLTASDVSASSVTLHQWAGRAVSDVAFGSDGQWLASGGEDICLWPVGQLELVRRARAVAGRELTMEERWQYLIPNAEAYAERGMELGAQEKWREAIEDFTRAAEMDVAKSYWPLYLKGIAQLATRDADGYRKTWRELFDRFKDAEPGEPGGRIVYGFIPGNPQPEMSAEIVRMAETYMREHPGWKRVLGGALLRDGHYAAAVEAFTEAAKDFDPRAWDLLLLAMAQHKNGQPGDARKTYQAAVDWITEANEKGLMREWWEQVEVEVLRAEAERLFQEAEKGERRPARTSAAAHPPPAGSFVVRLNLAWSTVRPSGRQRQVRSRCGAAFALVEPPRTANGFMWPVMQRGKMDGSRRGILRRNPFASASRTAVAEQTLVGKRQNG
jgi:WD40 repeat protein/serine/threonine protein kinase